MFQLGAAYPGLQDKNEDNQFFDQEEAVQFTHTSTAFPKLTTKYLSDELGNKAFNNLTLGKANTDLTLQLVGRFKRDLNKKPIEMLQVCAVDPKNSYYFLIDRLPGKNGATKLRIFLTGITNGTQCSNNDKAWVHNRTNGKSKLKGRIRDVCKINQSFNKLLSHITKFAANFPKYEITKEFCVRFAKGMKQMLVGCDKNLVYRFDDDCLRKKKEDNK